jgi:hypothetical protein
MQEFPRYDEKNNIIAFKNEYKERIEISLFSLSLFFSENKYLAANTYKTKH